MAKGKQGSGQRNRRTGQSRECGEETPLKNGGGTGEGGRKGQRGVGMDCGGGKTGNSNRGKTGGAKGRPGGAGRGGRGVLGDESGGRGLEGGGKRR